MSPTPTIFIDDVEISKLLNDANLNPAPKLVGKQSLGDLLTQGGFDLINIVFVFVGLIFFANLVMSGWDYMMSSGDPKKIASATSRLINGFLGLIMAITAFIVVRLISQALGLGGDTSKPII